MYNYPTLFPAISNRESFVQTIQIADDQTGDLITLTDANNNPLYAIFLEIAPPRHRGGYNGPFPFPSPYYDNHGDHGIIFASLNNFLSIIDTGTIQVQIPYTVIERLRGGETYDVFIRIVQTADFNEDFSSDFSNADDARQLVIGKLPVVHGGRGHRPFAPRGGGLT